MAIEGEQTTLRDTLEAAFDQVEETPPPAPADATAPAADAAPADATKTEGQPRGEDGKFVAKPKESAAAPKADTPPKADAAATPPAAAEPPKPLARPSSWKKEMWPLWEKLSGGQQLTPQEARQIAEYNLQRETEAARGVSAYKAEWDRAKPFLDAIAPYLPMYQQAGINPAEQFSKYAEIHRSLAMGDPQQKLGVLRSIIQDYKIPVEELFVQQNGQIFYNPQVHPAQVQQPARNQTSQSIEQQVQAALQRAQGVAAIEAMAKDVQKYPHFEAVRETMAQLLDAGIVPDLPGAYESALALPQHRELLEQQRQQQAAQAEAERKAKAAAEAQRARAAAVSPRSATPASGPAQAQKGRRELLSEQIDSMGSSRV